MAETLGGSGGGGVSIGTGATRRRGGTSSQSTALEDEYYADRLHMIRMASGDGLLFGFNPDVWIDLIYSDLSDEEMIASVLESVSHIELQERLKGIREFTKPAQNQLWAAFPKATQALLNSNGYSPPKDRPDKISWWNPFDWDDSLREGRIGNVPISKVVGVPLAAMTSPFRYVVSPAARGAWEGVNKSLNFSFRLGRTLHNQMDPTAMAQEEPLVSDPFLGIKRPAGTSVRLPQRYAQLITSFPTRWKNAEYEHASFSLESRAKALELLGNQQDYDIMIGGFRTGESDVLGAAIKYFTEKRAEAGSPDPEGEALIDVNNWFTSGVMDSREWKAAVEELDAGNFETSHLLAKRYDEMVRNVPGWIGGFADAPEDPADMGGFQKFRYTTGMIGFVGIGTMASAIVFDPITWGTIGYGSMVRGARAGIRTAQMGNYENTVRTMHRTASAFKIHSTFRAGERTEEAARSIMATFKYYRSGKSPERMMATGGRVRGIFRPKKNLTNEFAEYVAELGPNYVGRSPWYIRRQFNKVINPEIDRIVKVFNEYEIWRNTEVLAASRAGVPIKTPGPVVEFLRSNPKYRRVIEDMMRWHTDRMNNYRIADQTVLGKMGVTLKQPGLNSWDGVWEFFAEEAGHFALQNGLGGHLKTKLFFPRLTKFNRMRIAGTEGLLGYLDNFTNRMRNAWPHVQAEAAAGYIITKEGYLGQRLFLDVKSGVLPGLSAKARELPAKAYAEMFETSGTSRSIAGGPGAFVRIRPGRRAKPPETSDRVIRKYGITLEDYAILNRQMATYETKVHRDLHEIYKAIHLEEPIPKDIDRSLVKIVEERAPTLSDFYTLHEDTFGLLKFTKDGKPQYPRMKAWNRRGQMYVINRRTARNMPPGSSQAESAQMYPGMIQGVAYRTWDDLIDEGVTILNTNFATAAGKAGYKTPDELLTAVKVHGYRRVVDKLNAPTLEWAAPRRWKVKDLKKFLDEDIGIVPREKVLYDRAGKLTDKGMALVHSTLYHPARMAAKFTRSVPRNRFIDVTNSRTAIQEFTALAELGFMAEMPRPVIEGYISAFVHGTEGVRWDIQSRFLMDFMGRTGALVYGGQNIQRWFNRFIRQGSTAYSNVANDAIIGGMPLYRRAIFPGEAHGAQMSKLNILPSYRELGEASSYMNMMRMIGHSAFGPAMLDKFFARFWRPAVLMRIGVGLRNGVDETLLMVLREGPRSFANAKLAKTAIGTQKHFDHLGRAIPVLTTDQTRRSVIVSPIARTWRAVGDVLGIGDPAMTRKAVQVAKEKHLYNWDALGAARQEKEVIAARNLLTKDSETMGIRVAAHKGWKPIMQMLEASARITGRVFHQSARLPFVPTKQQAAQWALARQHDGERFIYAKMKQMTNPVILDSANDLVFSPFRSYFGGMSGTSLDEVLKLQGQRSDAAGNAIPYIELDYANSQMTYVKMDAGGSTQFGLLEAASQRLYTMQTSPEAVAAARAGAHHVDEVLEGFFRRNLTDDMIGVMRERVGIAGTGRTTVRNYEISIPAGTAPEGELTAVRTFKMNYRYEKSQAVKALGKSEKVTGDNTFDAIVAGQRMATTRTAAQLGPVKKGDTVLFIRDSDGAQVYVKITDRYKPNQKISREAWAELEGYGSPIPDAEWAKYGNMEQITFKTISHPFRGAEVPRHLEPGVSPFAGSVTFTDNAVSEFAGQADFLATGASFSDVSGAVRAQGGNIISKGVTSELLDGSTAAARTAYELIDDIDPLMRSYLRAYWENAPKFQPGEAWHGFPLHGYTDPLDIADALVGMGRTEAERNFLSSILRPTLGAADHEASKALAWLSHRDLKMGDLLSDVAKSEEAQRAAWMSEGMTILGQDRNNSMVRSTGIDPVIQRTMTMPNEYEIGFFFPQVPGDVGVALAYMFKHPETMIANEMRQMLGTMLSRELGSRDSARVVLNTLDPMMSPHGSMTPDAWLGFYMADADRIISSAIASQPASPAALASTLDEMLGVKELTDVAGMRIPLLTGAHNPEKTEKVLHALRDWRTWLHEGEIPAPQVAGALMDDATESLTGGWGVVRRLLTHDEYKATPGYGRYYGTTGGHKFARPSGAGPAEAQPVTVTIIGDTWGNSKSVPSGWTEELADGVPTGNWTVAGVGDTERMAAVAAREWVEEEVTHLSNSMLSLPTGSRVRYHAPSREARDAGYDQFGNLVNKVLTTINDHAGQSTIGQLERAIWEVVGDLPPGAGIPDGAWVGGPKLFHGSEQELSAFVRKDPIGAKSLGGRSAMGEALYTTPDKEFAAGYGVVHEVQFIGKTPTGTPRLLNYGATGIHDDARKAVLDTLEHFGDLLKAHAGTRLWTDAELAPLMEKLFNPRTTFADVHGFADAAVIGGSESTLRGFMKMVAERNTVEGMPFHVSTHTPASVRNQVNEMVSLALDRLRKNLHDAGYHGYVAPKGGGFHQAQMAPEAHGVAAEQFGDAIAWFAPEKDLRIIKGVERDFIGTVGGEKGTNGIRRIFTEHGSDEMVPTIELIGEPFGAVTEAFPKAVRYDAAAAGKSEAAALHTDVNVPREPQYLGETMGRARPTEASGGRARPRTGEERAAGEEILTPEQAGGVGWGVTRKKGARRNPKEWLWGGNKPKQDFQEVNAIDPAALWEYRDALLRQMIERGEVDTIWPFFRDGPSPGSVTEGLSQVDGIIAGSGTHAPRNPVEIVSNLTPKLLRDNPDKIFLYGDNLEGWGKAGQAAIRDEPNAIGIPTKKYPGMQEGHFFRDSEYAQNVRHIDEAFDQIPEGTTVVIPKAGLGTGRARMQQTAPKTFDYLQMRISEMQGIPSPTPIIGKGGVQTHGKPPGARRAAGEPGGRIPGWLQQTRAVAGEGSVPISWEARVGNPSAVARHVKARVYEPASQAPRTMWTWDTTMQRPVTPRDMGGFDVTGGPLGEHIGVSPYSLPEEMLEQAAHPSTIKKNVLWQDKQGDMMWLREGQEETIPWFNPGEVSGSMPTGPTVVHGDQGKNIVLSNWGEHPMTFRGKRFNTAEGAFQAHKAGEYYAGFEHLSGKEARVAARHGGAAGKGAEPGTYQGVQKIISGGQTGGDEAGLFAAEELGIATGGHMPKGYRVEGGTNEALAQRFGLVEHESPQWVPRTAANTQNSDGTIWFGNESPGKGATRREARNAGKPFIDNPTKERFIEWLEENNIQVLNVAGNRASSNPELYEAVKTFLTDSLSETPVVSAGKPIPTLETVIAGERADVTLMREILDAKYDQIPAFRTALLESGEITHPSVDAFWAETMPRLLTDLRAKKMMEQGEWVSMGEQWLGPYDVVNQIEHAAATGVDELNNLVSNFSRVGKSTMAQKGEMHHQINMELADSVDGIVSSGRVTRWGNSSLLPPQILARVPITAKPTAGERTLSVARNFFDGAVNPMIRAISREPMFDFYFAEALPMTRAVRNYYQHAPESFRALERVAKTSNEKIPAEVYAHRRLNPAYVGHGPEQTRLTITRRIDENGVEQVYIPELEEFIEFGIPWAPYALPPEGAPALIGSVEHLNSGLTRYKRLAELLGDYQQGIRPRHEIVEQIFRVDDAVRPKIGALTEDQALGFLVDAGRLGDEDFFRVLITEGPPPNLRPVASGTWFDTFPEHREFFVNMYMKNKERMLKASDEGRQVIDEYALFTRQVVEYVNLKSLQEQAHVNIASERALWQTSLFVDDHSLRSQWQESVGTMVPFWFAEEQFLRRWLRTLEVRPDALRNLSAALFASERSGLTYEDDMGTMRVFVPGSSFFPYMMDNFTQFPFLQNLMGEEGIGFIGGDMTSVTKLLLPGYGETTGNLQYGPMAGIPLLGLSTLDPTLRGQGILGFHDNIVGRYGYDSEASELIWQTIVPPPIAKLLAVVGIEVGDVGGTHAKSMMSAIEAAAVNGWLPSEQEMREFPNQELETQKVYDALNHVAKQLMLIQNLSWWGGLATGTPRSFVDDPNWEWNQKFQQLRDTGIPYEQAFREMLEEYRTEFWDEYVGEHFGTPDWAQNWEEADATTQRGITQAFKSEWLTELLRISAFQQGKTGKYTVAATPQTVAALDWMTSEGVPYLMDAAPLASTFFIPRGNTEDERMYESEARALQLARDMRFEKTPEQYLESIYISAAGIAYYGYAEAATKDLVAARLAGDRDLVKLIERRWDNFNRDFKKVHPIFAASTHLSQSKMRRENLMTDMRLLLADPSIVPDHTPHKDDILAGMALVVSMDNQLDLLTDRSDKDAQQARNRIKFDHMKKMEALLEGRPWLNEMYYNLFVPLISEEWTIKLQLGQFADEGLTVGINN